MLKKYLVITPIGFESTLLPLLDQKRGRGYEVIVKNVEDFTSGTGQGDQIRQFVQATLPDYLLLVGDYNLVPGYTLSYNGNNYLSDVYYGMANNDVVPALPTGRLSVNSSNELERICKRLLAYPEDPGRIWRRHVILAGWLPWEDPRQDPDNPGWGFIRENKENYFDPVYRFDSDNNIINNMGYDLTRDIWHVRNSTKATLIDAIESGASIVRYVGHGTEDGWYNIGGSGESFLLDDIAALQVDGRLPFVISATCLTGQITSSPSFAEKWLLREKAIAVFSADRSSSSYWNDRITQHIFHQIVTNRKRRLGDILVAAMKSMHDEFGNHDDFTKETYKMFRLIGDPDTVLTTPDDAICPVTKTVTISCSISNRTHGNSPISASGTTHVRFDRRVRRVSLGITEWMINKTTGASLSPVEANVKVSVTKIEGCEVEIEAHFELGHRVGGSLNNVELSVSMVALVDI